MRKTIARLDAEIKAVKFVTKCGYDWEEESKISQLAHIKNQDARVLTKEENQYIKDWQDGKIQAEQAVQEVIEK